MKYPKIDWKEMSIEEKEIMDDIKSTIDNYFIIGTPEQNWISKKNKDILSYNISFLISTKKTRND